MSSINWFDRRNVLICSRVYIVFLHNPVSKLVSIRSINARDSIGRCCVNIHIAIYRCTSSFTRISFSIEIRINQTVLYMDTIRTFQHFAPLGVQIQFSGNPETGLIRIQFFIFRIVLGYSSVIQLSNTCVEQRTVFPVPAYKCISICYTCIRADICTIRFTEIRSRIVFAPVNFYTVSRSFQMLEHTILDLTPFGINLNTANRHGCPFIFLCAAFINIPVIKDKSRFIRGIRFVVLVRFLYCHTLSYFRAF